MNLEIKVNSESIVMIIGEARLMTHLKGDRRNPKLVTHLNEQGDVKDGVIALQSIVEQDYWGAISSIINRLEEQYSVHFDPVKKAAVIHEWVLNVVNDYWNV